MASVAATAAWSSCADRLIVEARPHVMTPTLDSLRSFGFHVWEGAPGVMRRALAHPDIEVNYLLFGGMTYRLGEGSHRVVPGSHRMRDCPAPLSGSGGAGHHLHLDHHARGLVPGSAPAPEQ